MCHDQPQDILQLIRDLPLNLELPLRVLSDAEGPPSLERVADGAAIPATVQRLEAPGVWWLKADQDLESNTEYRIMRGHGVSAVFTTGTARDDSAPTLGRVGTVAGGNAGLCVDSIGGQVTLSGAADGEQFNVWVELELDVDGSTRTLFTDYNYGGISLGDSFMGCFGGNEAAGVADGGGYPGRVRLRDAAGNVGQWQTFALTTAAETPGGCGLPTDVPANPTTHDGSSARTSEGCSVSLGARPGSSLAGLLLVLALLIARKAG